MVQPSAAVQGILPFELTTPTQMHSNPARPSPPQVVYFWHDDVIRSRSVSGVVLSGQVDVPAPPARLAADWQRDVSQHLQLEPGDVEALPLARARRRWPDYHRCVQAVAAWTHALGMGDVLASSEVALMACRGARYHHDGGQYGDKAFCNLFLSEDQGLDLHFSITGHRIPLTRGTVVMFDTGQPHGVIERGSAGFDAACFATERDCTQVFLTWELPIEDAQVARALQITFDIDPATALFRHDAQVWVDGAPAQVCPATGRWRGLPLLHAIAACGPGVHVIDEV